jgi:hypothetical protein
MRSSYWRQLTKGASTIHGAGYDKFMSTFPWQRDVKPSAIPSNPYRGPNGEFRNVLTADEAFKTPKPSRPYMVIGKDKNGQPYYDGKATLENVFKNTPQMMQPALEQAAKARAQQANPSLSNYTGETLNHPVILNPDGIDRSNWRQKLWRPLGANDMPDMPAADPRRSVPIVVSRTVGRENYKPGEDRIYADRLPDYSPFPRPGVQINPPMDRVRGGDVGVNYESDRNRALYSGGAATWPRPGSEYPANVLFEEGIHASTPTSFYNNLPKPTSPDQFGPTNKLPGEPTDKDLDSQRGYTPTVPGMRGSYDQLPAEMVKSLTMAQRDATATYNYRLQEPEDLEKYYRMLGVFGPEDKWKKLQQYVPPQQADSMGQVREQSKLQREQDYQRDLDDYRENKLHEFPVPVEERELEAPRGMMKFLKDTNALRQVVKQGPSVRPPLLQQPAQAPQQPPQQAPEVPALAKQARVASTLNSAYNSLMNQARMRKIAATLQKATDGLKLSARPAGQRIQPARVMSTPTSAEVIEQKRESEGDAQAKQAKQASRVAGRSLFMRLTGQV